MVSVESKKNHGIRFDLNIFQTMRKNKLLVGIPFEKYFFISLLKHLKDFYGF